MDILKNKKVFISLSVIVLAVIALLVVFQNRDNNTQPSLSISITPKPPIKELNGKTKIILNAVNNSEREGWVIIKELEGKIWLSINIEADEIEEDDHDFPATLRSGTCSNIGDVRHTLTPVYNGGSETTIGMSLEEFRESLPLSLVVEESPTENKIVACGDITTVYY